MSWGGYIPGDMIRSMVEEGKIEEFVDTFYGREHTEGVQEEETTEGQVKEDEYDIDE